MGGLLEYWLAVWFTGCPVEWIDGRVAGLKDFQMVGRVYGCPYICYSRKPVTQPSYYKYIRNVQ